MDIDTASVYHRGHPLHRLHFRVVDAFWCGDPPDGTGWLQPRHAQLLLDAGLLAELGSRPVEYIHYLRKTAAPPLPTLPGLRWWDVSDSRGKHYVSRARVRLSPIAIRLLAPDCKTIAQVERQQVAAKRRWLDSLENCRRYLSLLVVSRDYDLRDCAAARRDLFAQ